MGDTTIDPADDVQKLQGKWSRIPQGEGAARWPESYLVIDGDIAIFEHPTLGEDGGQARKPGEKPYVVKYRIVLNSGVDPKVIRYTHSLGVGDPVPMSRTHPEFNQWYKLDGDTLTIWTKWANVGERAPVSYRRFKGEI